MFDTWIIPGGVVLQENEDGAVWLVPGVVVVNEAEAAAAGWTGKFTGITNPAKINGVAVANISKVMGVS